MKRIIRMLRLLWNIRRREHDLMIQRFEILEHFLRCVQTVKQLDEFDTECESLLEKKDYHTQRYAIMMIRRFKKERHLCISEDELHALHEKEGAFILKQHGIV